MLILLIQEHNVFCEYRKRKKIELQNMTRQQNKKTDLILLRKLVLIIYEK